MPHGVNVGAFSGISGGTVAGGDDGGVVLELELLRYTVVESGVDVGLYLGEDDGDALVQEEEDDDDAKTSEN